MFSALHRNADRLNSSLMPRHLLLQTVAVDCRLEMNRAGLVSDSMEMFDGTREETETEAIE